MGYASRIGRIVSEVNKGTFRGIEEIKTPSIGAYPDPLPAVLIDFPDRRV
jgi:hypothetical protein